MRKSYIDNIRSLTILLVVLYHVIYMFNHVATDGVIGPVTAFHGQDTLQYLLYPWFMVILFILSGMCSRFYLEKHTEKEYIRARTRKLLVPSTIGVLVFGWAQGYFNMAISHAFDNIPETIPGPVLYLILCVSGTGVLWTIQVMWILSMILLLIRKLEKGRLSVLAEKAGILTALLLGILIYGSAQILNMPVICVYRFGIYGMAFLTGYYVFTQEKVIKELERYWLPLLLAAFAAGILYTCVYYGKNYAVEPYVNSPLAVLYGWLMCLAVIGGMKRFADRESRVWQLLKQRSFGLYVFHYLPLSACAYALYTYTNLPGILLYVLTGLAAFFGGLLLYEIVKRIPGVHWCLLGLQR